VGGQGRDDAEALMALNLIKVSRADGEGVVFVGVAQITLVNRTAKGSRIYLAHGTDIEVFEPPQTVAELCNRRPPDGQ